MVVRDRDGEEIGVLEEIRFAERKGSLAGIVVRVGATSRHGGTEIGTAVAVGPEQLTIAVAAPA